MAHPHQILETLGASPLKSRSQNFLTSPHWAERLAQGVLDASAEEYWEIGPGLGAITHELVTKTTKPISIFEIDKRFSEYLKAQFPAISVHHGDFLKINLEQLCKKKRAISLVSNVPYHISSPLFFKILPCRTSFLGLVMTFQKEFAARLVATPRTKEYGALSVIAQHAYEIRKMGTLPRQAFYPVPTVGSSAMKLLPLTRTAGDGEKKFFTFVRASFAHRRKKLLTNVREYCPSTDWEALFSDRGMSNNVRAEELHPSEFERLWQILNP